MKPLLARASLVKPEDSSRIAQMNGSNRLGVLFICMGNICRSPLAEGLFLHKINQLGVAKRFAVDSCGTGGWHVGERPDHRILDVASQHGISLPSRARQVHVDDFDHFEYLICMDQENQANVISMGAPLEKVRLLLEFDGASPEREVPDPYYGGPQGFDHVFLLIDAATDSMLECLLRESS
jgi:protein-tyrosine phosphatase